MTDDELPDSARAIAEAFAEGPYRDFAEEAGRIIMRKLAERGMSNVDPADIDPELSEQLLRAAWIEAGITKFPAADPDKIIADLTRLFDMMAMDLAANADGGDTEQ